MELRNLRGGLLDAVLSLYIRQLIFLPTLPGFLELLDWLMLNFGSRCDICHHSHSCHPWTDLFALVHSRVERIPSRFGAARDVALYALVLVGTGVASLHDGRLHHHGFHVWLNDNHLNVH